MNFKNIIFIITFFLFSLNATVYEDAEDKQILQWKIINPNANTSIHNVYDKNRKSNIISFKGKGTKSSFKLDAIKRKIDSSKNYILSWSMKFKKDFVLIVVVETKMGKRYLIYTPGNNNSYMQYGLGDLSVDGSWRDYSRNLQDDLSYFDNRNEILSFCNFIVRGSGSIDNIEIKDSYKFKEVEKVEIKSKTISRKITLRKTIKGDNVPKINIKGANPLYLNIEEKYIENGANAYDIEDGELGLTICDNIDINNDGEYKVIYMVKDMDGNIAIDKRSVIVGNYKPKIEKVVKSINVEIDSNFEKNEEEEYLAIIGEKEVIF